jgi:pimeloyl-ACP methyl ester carboxylesterase
MASVAPELPGVTQRFVELDGCRVHLAEAGEGPPLLLLHGWPQHWWCWRHLIPELAKRYRVLAPDLRGFGWSEAPPGNYAKLTFAEDALALLELEGIDRVRLIGHDWGGYAAFLLALEHPERVERLLALDITPPWRGGFRARQLALPLLASYQALLATPVLGRRVLTTGPQFVRTLIRAGSGPAAHWSTQELDVYAEVLRNPARARASSACYRTFLTRELAEQLNRSPSQLSVPTLLLMGSRSAIGLILGPAEETNLRVETIRGAGHFLAEEAPAEVLAWAEDWFGASAPRNATARSSAL